jgi:hypothetical protein
MAMWNMFAIPANYWSILELTNVLKYFGISPNFDDIVFKNVSSFLWPFYTRS